jgi:hypothetical protein
MPEFVKDPNCAHKYVLKRTESFYQENGRYNNKFTLIDYFFCEKCLDEKETKKQINCGSDRWYELPDWAKLITKKVA